MPKEDRPIHVRTDASADDWWSRVRSSKELSPEFRVLSQAEQIQRCTPFGRQERPRLFTTELPTPSPHPELMTSRAVERLEMSKAIREAEADKENLTRALDENVALKRRIEHLEINLARALRINHALTGNMISSK